MSSSYSLQGQKLEEALELLMDKMVQLGLIKEHERAGIAHKVGASLEAAYPNGQVPLDVINNPAQQKKLMGLIVCAVCEKAIENNPALKNNPKLTRTFDTAKLAEAMFKPEDYSPQAKLAITAFVLALKPGAVLNKKIDDIANDMFAQKKRFDNDAHDLNADAAFDEKLAQELAEFNFIQAFGSSLDGTPPILLFQASNAMGAADNTTNSGATALGFLNEDQNPNSPNISSAVKEQISIKKEELGIAMETFNKELVDHRIAPNVQAPRLQAPE